MPLVTTRRTPLLALAALLAALAATVAALAAGGSARAVAGTPDGAVHFSSASMARVAASKLPEVTRWRKALWLTDLTYDGSGVNIALVDTGVAPVEELWDRVVASVDLTPEGDGVDHYGHGTHMAGVIAGNGWATRGLLTGAAPGAGIVSVKVAGADGKTDVSAVIAGIQWVVAHKAQYGIRVLNLSFGTDSTAPYTDDPLDFAVEQAWNAGIVVVVSAGNRGPGPGTIDKPGDDPYVITVGAYKQGDDKQPAVMDFSGRGPTADGLAKPDLLGWGSSVVSVRAPGSTVDSAFTSAQLGTALFKGTGTSQAAASVSALAALMLQANPALTPDQVKADMLATAGTAHGLAGSNVGGAGVVDGGAAIALAQSPSQPPPANQGLTPSRGLGLLDASRGSVRIEGAGGAPLNGETNANGRPWIAKTWSTSEASAKTWSGDQWVAKTWSTAEAAAKTWSDNGWVAKTWSNSDWVAKTWSNAGWVAKTWSGAVWTAGAWSTSLWNTAAYR